ncbi:hypothetical protein BLGI_3751 [Brevibacillus laterosporus GI-9]|nr:hypothetical protein BLGI_3751 [Brevibacillus laterosporus GI-9]
MDTFVGIFYCHIPLPSGDYMKCSTPLNLERTNKMKKLAAATLAICFVFSNASVFAMEEGHHKHHKVKTVSHKKHHKAKTMSHKKHHKAKTMSHKKHHKFHIKGMPKTGMGGASN